MSMTVRGNVTNVLNALRNPNECGHEFECRGNNNTLYVRARDESDWQPYTNMHYLRIQLALERIGFRTVPKSRVKGVALLVAQERNQREK